MDNDHIKNMGFSNRTVNALLAARIRTKFDLMEKSIRELSLLQGIGPGCLDEIRAVTRKHGIDLKVGKKVKFLEKDVEGAVSEYAKSKGWLTRKWTSPGHDGVPDRLFFRDGRVVIIEFKRPGEEPRPNQLKEHRELMDHGHIVYVIDNIPAGKALFDSFDSTDEFGL